MFKAMTQVIIEDAIALHQQLCTRGIILEKKDALSVIRYIAVLNLYEQEHQQ